MKVEESVFAKLLAKTAEEGAEGIVILGAGGDLQEWITGITGVYFKEGAVEVDNPEEIWAEALLLKTTGERTDLVLTFNSDFAHINMGRLAMLRIQMHSDIPVSWISDYVVNYASHHGFATPEEDEEV